ncbi:hypothetical protein [Ferrovibrio terrae]|uniref:hypothetical protein n=1 Tax=Ferrovibrio terrae TaxID=2594003 RepID=UPI0031383D48
MLFAFSQRRSDLSRVADSVLNIRIGTEGVDFAPIEQNSSIAGAFDGFELSWAAQSGVTAYIFVSQGPDALRFLSPPAKQLVTSSVGTTLATNAVSAATAATLLSAANALRQSVTLQNRDTTKDVAIGGSGVTMASGFILEPGAIKTIDKTTAAIYGRVAAGTADVRVLEELS